MNSWTSCHTASFFRLRSKTLLYFTFLTYVPIVAFYRRLLFWFLFDILWTMWISFNDFCFYFFLGCVLKHIVTLWICGRNLRRIKRCLLGVWSVLSVQPTMRDQFASRIECIRKWMISIITKHFQIGKSQNGCGWQDWGEANFQRITGQFDPFCF